MLSLVRRMELGPKLLRRHLEEQIIALVPLEDSFIESRSSLLKIVPLKSSLVRRVGLLPILSFIYDDLKRCAVLHINVLRQALKIVSLHLRDLVTPRSIPCFV